MIEMFTDADPMRSDDYRLPADGWRETNRMKDMNTEKLRAMNLGDVADEIHQLRDELEKCETAKATLIKQNQALAIENERLSSEQRIEVKQLITDWESADDEDGSWESPHPIFQMALELDMLRAKLAAMESQGLVAYGIPNTAITGRKQRFMTLHLDRCGQYPELMEPLYALPVPADKPAVAVPDGWALVPIEPTKEMLSAGAIYEDSYQDMLSAAPSHSQQSAESGPQYMDELQEKLAPLFQWVRKTNQLKKEITDFVRGLEVGISNDAEAEAAIFAIETLIREFVPLRRDRCPSHESEQGENNE